MAELEAFALLNRKRYRNVDPKAVPVGQERICDICERTSQFECIVCRSQYCSVEHLYLDDEGCHKQVCGLVEQLQEIGKESVHRQSSPEMQKKVMELKKEVRIICSIAARRLLWEGKAAHAFCASQRALRLSYVLYGEVSCQVCDALSLRAQIQLKQGVMDEIETNLLQIEAGLVRQLRDLRSFGSDAVLQPFRDDQYILRVLGVAPCDSIDDKETDYFRNACFQTPRGKKVAASLAAYLSVKRDISRSNHNNADTIKYQAAVMLFTYIAHGPSNSASILELLRSLDPLGKRADKSSQDPHTAVVIEELCKMLLILTGPAVSCVENVVAKTRKMLSGITEPLDKRLRLRQDLREIREFLDPSYLDQAVCGAVIDFFLGEEDKKGVELILETIAAQHEADLYVTPMPALLAAALRKIHETLRDLVDNLE